MKTVRIVGVPEHFNLPWHLAIEEGAFAERGIDLIWEDIPEGTGRMCELLKNEETDLAVILTEGIIKSISEGNPVKIVQEYISSPLLWGIHVAKNSEYQSVAQLEDAPIAISRMGSGSHLMANVHAQNQGWIIDKMKYEIINNLDGAIKAFTEGSKSYFLWEHFTTKPWVEKGVFRRLGDCPTPWPCFVIAATERFLSEKGNLLNHILEVINTYSSEFKKIPSIDRTLSNRYGQNLEDIQVWLSKTEWGQQQISQNIVNEVQKRLLELELIDVIRRPKSFMYQLK